MSEEIFVLSDENTLHELHEKAFEKEDTFQTLLERYPALLSGSRINKDAPRKWLLIKREQGIPGDESGRALWAVDHLLVDQDAIPTLVEVKCASDTRIRREVVGQMLDYAANSVSYLDAKKIRARFEANCEMEGEDAESKIAWLTEGEVSSDAFWDDFQTNLSAGKIRMLFVADSIPTELERIIEFLNIQMTPAEVLGIELKQFADKTIRTIVPRIVGKTAATKDARAATRQWDKRLFYEEVEKACPGYSEHIEELFVPMETNGTYRWYGHGASTPSQFCMFEGKAIFGIYLYPSGKRTIEICFQYLKDRKAFAAESARHELRERLNAIHGIVISEDKIRRRPSIPLEVIGDSGHRAQLSEVFCWVVERLKETFKN